MRNRESELLVQDYMDALDAKRVAKIFKLDDSR